MSELPGMTYQEGKELSQLLIAEAVSKGTYIFTAVQNKRKDYKISRKLVARSFEVVSNSMPILFYRPTGTVRRKETKNGRGGIPSKSVVQGTGEDGITPGSHGPRKVR